MIEYISLAAITTSGITGLIWAIRLEGKVNEHDQLFEEREKQRLERTEADGSRLEELKDHLIRIESKLDAIAYGAHKADLHG
jgi:Tfp pilus assembly protein PilO